MGGHNESISQLLVLQVARVWMPASYFLSPSCFVSYNLLEKQRVLVECVSSTVSPVLQNSGAALQI
eukprot:1148211-Pelagomonas_calceolata.AAC.1